MTLPESDAETAIDSLNLDNFSQFLQDDSIRVTLDNGLEVVLQQNHKHPLLSAQVWVKTGSIHEHPLLGSGLSHYLEHMLFKGTSKRKAGQVSGEVQAFGGYINAYTAFDRTVYLIDGPSSALNSMVDLLEDITLNSVIDPEETAKEKEVILREIDMGFDDPDRILSRKLLANAFIDHPYRHPVIGHKSLFSQITREQLWAYYKSRYIPNNMVVVLSGDFQVEDAISLIEKTFGTHAMQPAPLVNVPSEPEQLAMRRFSIEGDYNMCRMSIAFKIPSMRDPRSPKLDVLATAIASGQSSLLRERLRNQKQLIHSISASAWNPGTEGLFWFSILCDPEKADAAETALLSELSELSHYELDATLIEKAKRFAIVSEIHSRQTTHGMASRLGLINAMVKEPAYPEKFLNIIHSVQPEDLCSLASDTFRLDKMIAGRLTKKSEQAVSKANINASKQPVVEEIKLDNGARLILHPDKSLPRVNLRTLFSGGASVEPDNSSGYSALLATLLLRDTKRYSAESINKIVEGSGGNFSESCGNNSIGISLEMFSQDFHQAISLMKSALLEPLFLDETVEIEKDAQLAAIRESGDEIFDLARKRLKKLFFKGHPIGNDILGSEETIRAVTANSLKTWYNRIADPDNLVFIVSGDFDKAAAIDKASAMLSSFKPVTQKMECPSFNSSFNNEITSEVFDRNQSIVLQAFNSPGVLSAKAEISDVFDEFLSDMAGPLFSAVREDESLAYFVGASRVMSRDFGMFYLYAGTHPDATMQVFDIFDKEFKKFTEGSFSQEMLKHVINKVMVQSLSTIQSLSARTTRIALNALYNKPLLDWIDMENRYKRISPADLIEFAEELSQKKSLRYCLSPKELNFD